MRDLVCVLITTPDPFSGPRPFRDRVTHQTHVGHPSLSGGTPRSLLPHPRGISLHISTCTTLVILMPRPHHFRPKRPARLQIVRQPLASVLAGPLHRRLAQTNPRHLVEQVGPTLKTVGDRPGQGGHPLQPGREMPGREPGLLVEGE